ncbi:MAG: Dabb family protein [Chitinophagaceae bacterium]
MPNQSRRQFIATTGKMAAAGAFISIPAADKKIFIHHVYFWLKNHDSIPDKEKLIDGLKKLSAVKTIQRFHIGQPAATHRDVIDSSYNISWCLFFNNKADQESYQTDPIHLNFVKECADLWTKVIVYDAEDI